MLLSVAAVGVVARHTSKIGRRCLSASSTHWNNNNDSSNVDELTRLRRLFAAHSVSPLHNDYLIARNPDIAKLERSSVLVPISVGRSSTGTATTIDDKAAEADRRFYITLTKRSATMNTFKGQVCFVGGKQDASDADAIATALREAKEEVNMDATHLSFVGQLCPVVTTSGALVTPVVALLDARHFRPHVNAHEVELLFELPAERFLEARGHMHTPISNGSDHFFIHYFGDTLGDGRTVTTWGVTAFLCVIVSSILHGRAPNFQFDPLTEIPATTSGKGGGGGISSDYLEDFLLVKSKRLVHRLTNRKSVQQPRE